MGMLDAFLKSRCTLPTAVTGVKFTVGLKIMSPTWAEKIPFSS